MSPAFAAMLEALRTTSGNIRSLAPAGHIEPFTPYRPWLRVVEDAIALAEQEAQQAGRSGALDVDFRSLEAGNQKT